jgi:rhodanese-related sulfurtransferase
MPSPGAGGELGADDKAGEAGGGVWGVISKRSRGTAGEARSDVRIYFAWTPHRHRSDTTPTPRQRLANAFDAQSTARYYILASIKRICRLLGFFYPLILVGPSMNDSNSFRRTDIAELTPTELAERLEREHPLVLVDVREPFEAEIADLPEVGQHRIPMAEFVARMGELDPDDTLVIYCRSGARSAWATGQLMAAGYTQVYNLKGGVLGWRAEVDPTLEAY